MYHSISHKNKTLTPTAMCKHKVVPYEILFHATSGSSIRWRLHDANPLHAAFRLLENMFFVASIPAITHTLKNDQLYEEEHGYE